MDGEIAGLRRPETGAIAALPVPYEPVPIERADAEAFQSTAGEFRKGLRSSVNRLGASAHALAGSIGEAAGLTDFAAARFAEAQDYVDFSEEVGPRVRDYRAVKDITDATNFVAGLSGTAAGSTLPAVAGGLAGARFGLRGMAAGAFTGSFVPNAGEQALTVKDAPASAGDRLINAAGTGAAQAALDTLSAGGAFAGMRRIAQAVQRPGAEAIGKAVAKGTAAEALTETAQEKIGQVAHGAIDPTRDSSDDTHALINAAIGGAVGGTTITASSAAAAKVPGVVGSLREAYAKNVRERLAPSTDEVPGTAAEAKEAMGVLDKPMDPDDFSWVEGVPPEQIPDRLDFRDNEVAKQLLKWHDKVREQPWAKRFTELATDPDQRTEFAAELREHFKQAVEHPAVRKAAADLKGFVKHMGEAVDAGMEGVRKHKEGKHALGRTAVDIAFYDNLLKHADPAKLEALTPTQRQELATDLKSYMLASFGQRTEVEGPGKPGTRRVPTGRDAPADQRELLGDGQGNVRPAPKTGAITEEGPRETVPARIPHALMDLFGDKLEPLLSSSHELLKGFGQPLRNVDYKKGVSGAVATRGAYRTKLEETVRSALRDKWLADPAEREETVRVATQQLQRIINEGPGDWAKFDRMMSELFGPRADAVLDAFEQERRGITRTYEHFVDEVPEGELDAEEVVKRLEQNDRYRVSLEDDRVDETADDGPIEEDAPSKADENSPYRDKRLGKPYEEMTEARKVLEDLRADPSYSPRRVSFRAEPVMEEYVDEQGEKKLRMTGKVTLHAEDAQSKSAYDDQQWENIREKNKQAGLAKGVITIERYDALDEKGKPVLGKNGEPKVTRVAVSVPNLTAETARSTGRQGEGPEFWFDMVRRGISNLMSDPRFAQFAGARRKDLAKKDVDAQGLLSIPDSAVVAVVDGKPMTWGELANVSRAEAREAERQYWKDVTAKLQAEANEYFKRKKRNPSYEDEVVEEYVRLRDARRAGEEGSKEAYEKFVKEWAQENEEKASGYQSDETKGGGTVGIRAIEAAFDRENRIEHLTHLLEGVPPTDEKPGGAPGLYAKLAKMDEDEELGAQVPYEDRKELDTRIWRIEQELTDLAGGWANRDTKRQITWLQREIAHAVENDDTKEAKKLARELKELRRTPLSSTLKENEIEQTDPYRAEAEPRKFQEETGRPFNEAEVGGDRTASREANEQFYRPGQPRPESPFVEGSKRPEGRLSPAQARAESKGGEGGAVRHVQYVTKDGKPTGSRMEKLATNKAELLKAPGGAQGGRGFGNVPKGKPQFDPDVTSEAALLDTGHYAETIFDLLDDDQIVEQFRMHGHTDEEIKAAFKEGYKTQRRDAPTDAELEKLLKQFPFKPKFSEMRLGTKPMTDEDKADIRKYVDRVLGKDTQLLESRKIKGAGMFEEVDGVERILISLYALDPKSVGYHEAAHALLARLRKSHPEAHNTLMAAAGSPYVVAQLRSLLKGEPAALEQLKDAEERVAYMYQFWAARDKKGKPLLSLGPKATSVFESLKKFLRGVLNAWTELPDAAQDKAEQILLAFHNGQLRDRSAAGRALDRLLPKRAEGVTDKVAGWAKRVLYTADGYVRDMKIPALTAIADKMMSPMEAQGTPSGYMQVKHVRRNEFMSRYTEAVKKLSEKDAAKLLEHLQLGTRPARGELRAAHAEVRQLLDDLYKYMDGKKVKVVEWDADAKEYKEYDVNFVPNYFPRAYDKQAIVEKYNEFQVLLTKYGVEDPGLTIERLVGGKKADPNETDWTAGLTYYAPNTMTRKLNIPEAELAPYMKKDLGAIMYGYINHAVRRAEYAERFGNQGQKIAEAIEDAKRQGATEEQVQAFSQYVQAMEGSLGNDISPQLKSFFGAMLTYQNLRLLPLALFSSLVDPAGIVVRGGTMKEGLAAFVRGVRELVSDSEDSKRRFARTVGAINEATDEQMVADAYGANFAEGWQRWMNNKLFKWNGMESWNNSMRIAGAAAAEQFLIRQVKKPGKHSERWLAELGLTKDDIRVTGRGDKQRVELTPVVVEGINKWVDGAVLRPHAGIRPIWMSDPHFMLISHLKQFTYSFQKAIVARSAHEAQHGNVTPLLALTSYVPLIIAADILRAVVTPGGSDDDRLNKWDMVDWMQHGVMRAGITGPGQYVFDAGRDLAHGGYGVESVLGPSVEQMVGILRGAAGAPGTDLAREATRAIPPVPALNLR